jgi:hypothetical protein
MPDGCGSLKCCHLPDAVFCIHYYMLKRGMYALWYKRGLYARGLVFIKMILSLTIFGVHDNGCQMLIFIIIH